MTEITENINTELTAGDPLLPSQDGVIPEMEGQHDHPVMIRIVDDQGDTVSFFPAEKI